MSAPVCRIYVFTNGTQIDMEQIILIGAIDKSTDGTIFMPIFCKGYNKPIHITMGNSIGKVNEETMQRIKSIYNNFLKEWNNYILQKNN